MSESYFIKADGGYRLDRERIEREESKERVTFEERTLSNEEIKLRRASHLKQIWGAKKKALGLAASCLMKYRK